MCDNRPLTPQSLFPNRKKHVLQVGLKLFRS